MKKHLTELKEKRLLRKGGDMITLNVFGAPYGIRTRDTQIKSLVLYQLS